MAINLAGKNLTLDISPFMNSGYIFKRLRMREEIGDEIASGQVEMTTDGTDMSLISSQKTINILLKQLDGTKYDITGYIYSRDFLSNEYTAKFIAIGDKEFTTVNKVAKYKVGIKKTIQSLYPGKVDIKDNIEPDVPGELLYLDQNGSTSLDFCSRLCRSYKKDTVYSFGLEGLSIKSINSKPIDPPIVANSDCMVVDMYNLNYYKEMELSSEKKSKTENIQPRMYNFIYEVTKNDFHSDLLDIYQYNTRYFTDMYTRIKLRYSTQIPNFKIGDVVTFRDKYNFNRKRYVVTRIDISIELNTTIFECELSGWEDGGI